MNLHIYRHRYSAVPFFICIVLIGLGAFHLQSGNNPTYLSGGVLTYARDTTGQKCFPVGSTPGTTQALLDHFFK